MANQDTERSKFEARFNPKQEKLEYELNRENDSKEEEKDDIDFIFDNFVGGGRWNDSGQWILFAPIMVIAYTGLFPIFMHIYAAFEPKYRCFIPICENGNTSSKVDVDWISFSSPTINTEGACKTEMVRRTESFNPCRRYGLSSLKVSKESCSGDSFDTLNVQKCDRYVYDKSIVEESLTTKLDLVCDLEYQQRIIGTMVMVGLLLGSELGGRISDKFGRRYAMMISTLIIIPTTMFAGYSSNFWTYAVLKLINTIGLPCIWFASHTLIIELFGRDCRQTAVVVKELIWPLGLLPVIWVFYLTRHWVYFHLYMGGLCTLAIPACIIIPESPRWLVANGKWQSAEKVLLKIARWNRKKLSANERMTISAILSRLDRCIDYEKEKSPGICYMISHKYCKNSVIMTLNWIIVCITCFTLNWNVTKLSGDVFLNSILLTLLGDVAGKPFVGIALKYCSRRFSLFIFQFLCGVFCIFLAFLPSRYELVVISFYMLAMCASNAAFAVVYLITGELYPTNLRTRSMATCSMISRIFGISAAHMSKLACVWKPLPMLILGMPSVLIGCLSYFLPETAKTKLPLLM